MSEIEDTQHTEVMHRTSDYTPRRGLAHYLIGRPLQTADAPHQTIGKAIGLAVFASDALSSTAYATQEILGRPGSRWNARLRLRFPGLAGDCGAACHCHHLL